MVRNDRTVALKLKGKRALVTGSCSGLGKAIAKMLAQEGAAVVIHGRDEARASAVGREIRDQGGRASVVLGDLSSDAGADAVASSALKDGQVDILVNNAGAYHHLGWMETNAKVWNGNLSSQRDLCRSIDSTIGSADEKK